MSYMIDLISFHFWSVILQRAQVSGQPLTWMSPRCSARIRRLVRLSRTLLALRERRSLGTEKGPLAGSVPKKEEIRPKKMKIKKEKMGKRGEEKVSMNIPHKSNRDHTKEIKHRLRHRHRRQETTALEVRPVRLHLEVPAALVVFGLLHAVCHNAHEHA